MTDDSNQICVWKARNKLFKACAVSDDDEVKQRINNALEELSGEKGGDSPTSLKSEHKTPQNDTNVESLKPNPGAWRWRDNAGVNRVTLSHTSEPINDNNDMFGEERLYSAETIQEAIQQKKEEMGDKPSQFDRLDRNAWKERRQTLEELEASVEKKDAEGDKE